MSMKIVNDHPFTDEEIAYLRNCNREREIAQNAADFKEAEVNPDDSYDKWKLAELKAEVDARNAVRAEGDQLKVDGKDKSAYAAVLEADDARTARVTPTA